MLRRLHVGVHVSGPSLPLQLLHTCRLQKTMVSSRLITVRIYRLQPTKQFDSIEWREQAGMCSGSIGSARLQM